MCKFFTVCCLLCIGNAETSIFSGSKQIGLSCLLCITQPNDLGGNTACKPLASIFVRSYYYLLVIYVAVIPKVWLLTSCCHPPPWLLEPARCLTEPGFLSWRHSGCRDSDAALEPAAGFPCQWCGRRLVMVSLACGTPPLPATPTH
jgi:hypothetical protein